MSTPLLPTTDEVAQAWLRLAVSGVRVDEELPTVAEHAALATVGAVRTVTVDGGLDRYVPVHLPVVTAECWVAVVDGSRKRARGLAGQLGARLVAATFDPALMGVVVDLPGDYGSARVHTVTALTDPELVDNEPSSWARYDVDLELLWTAM